MLCRNVHLADEDIRPSSDVVSLGSRTSLYRGRTEAWTPVVRRPGPHPDFTSIPRATMWRPQPDSTWSGVLGRWLLKFVEAPPDGELDAGRTYVDSATAAAQATFSVEP
jgi:hypothetical protein